MRRFLNLYFVGSCLLGGMEIVDALVLIKSGGTFGTESTLFAIGEAFWVLVSCAAVIISIAVKVNPTIPISFVTYVIIGWSLTIFFAIFGGGKFLPVNAAGEHVLPIWAYYFGLGFGTYFMVANAITLARLAKKPVTSAQKF